MVSVNPLHPLFGAEVAGVDLRRPVDDATFTELRAAFDRFSVLVFHDQPVTDEEQVAFSRRFGPLETLRKGAVAAGSPYLVVLTNVGKQGEILPPRHDQVLNGRANQLWHTDSSFKPVPALASLLSAREVPPTGGETEFASMRAAWDALPEAKRAGLEGLVAVHDFAHSRAQIDPDFVPEDVKLSLPPVRQALVRTDPVTGRKALYLGSHASHIEGMPVETGRALLQELLAFATQPQFVYRHEWRPGDLVLWDNRATLHRGRPYEAGQHRRLMVRATVAGEGPTVAQAEPAAA